MASLATLKMNMSIPKPTMILVKEGNPNNEKQMRREHKRTSRGRSFLDFTRTKGAFGNRPVKTIPPGYDGVFPKKAKVNV
jgi:hypothetical protein